MVWKQIYRYTKLQYYVVIRGWYQDTYAYTTNTIRMFYLHHLGQRQQVKDDGLTLNHAMILIGSSKIARKLHRPAPYHYQFIVQINNDIGISCIISTTCTSLSLKHVRASKYFCTSHGDQI